MTKNQIDYQNYLESTRHNRATEFETGRSNRAGERETNRHNLATEGEASRHNMATELTANNNLLELNRHQTATEAQAAAELAERKRSNLKNEALTKRGQDKVYDASIRQQDKQLGGTIAKLQNDLEIAKQNNANAKTIAQIQADINKYTAEQARLGRENAASISAGASKYATDAKARTDLAVAEINRAIQQAHDYASKWNTQQTNLSKEQIAEQDRLSNEAIKAAERLQTALRDQNTNDARKAQLALDKEKAKVEAAYKKAQITREFYDMIMGILGGMGKAARDAMDLGGSVYKSGGK